MRRRRTETRQETMTQMFADYIAAGAWNWLRAEGDDENLVSALNRMRYRTIVQRFESLNIQPPTPADLYAAAAEKWPAHKLHPAPKGA